MRVLVAVLVIGHALACATPALAADPKPEVVEEIDLLRAQLADANAALLQAQAEIVRLRAIVIKADPVTIALSRADEAAARLREKYKLSDGDGIDPQTRQIRRKPKQGAK